MKIEMCDENPFKYVLQEKLMSTKPVTRTIYSKNTEVQSSRTSIWVWIGFIILAILILILIGLVIWALITALGTKSKIDSVQAVPGPAGSPGPAGPPGTPGSIGPQGPPGSFYFIGLGAVSGIYTSGCVKVPTEHRISIPNSDNGYLIFDKRLPDAGKLSDQLGTVTVGQDGVYVMYVSLQLKIEDEYSPVVVRVYKNNVMFGYYEYSQSGSQSFTIANSYKQGDQIRIAISSNCEKNELLTHGSFVSVLTS